MDAGEFVFVSFGSASNMPKASNMPSHLKQIFFDTMRKANIKFVLKWDDKIPKEMPKNVFPASWLPQQSVLGNLN
jgi:hypothetical protein